MVKELMLYCRLEQVGHDNLCLFAHGHGHLFGHGHGHLFGHDNLCFTYKTCSNLKYNINSFTILRKCNSDYEAKIHEALLIKPHRPSLNKQCYASGASFLLNIY